MRKKIKILCCCLFLLCFELRAQLVPSKISIIPEPSQLVRGSGIFKLPAQVLISANAQQEVNYAATYLKDKLSKTGRGVKIVNQESKSANIKLILLSKTDQDIGLEGYYLSVTGKDITIKANKAAGLFYGVQTLLQLFPNEIESVKPVQQVNWILPCVEIKDAPRLSWRGLMFDVSRHFFTKEEIRQYIDIMVKYKYNLLHLHLTDDEGWRIEIKSLPKLTETGAWNVKKVGNFGGFEKPKDSEPRNYGGFYTHEDIKELVQYAKARFVQILPEIDVPGHSLAAIASYPELSCTEGAEQYRVRSGEPIMDWSHGAPPIAYYDNTLCPANEKVYAFLDKVIKEVAELFPFEYIHMGGDEAAINFWQKSNAVKALMEKEGFENMHQVQGYFEKRVQKLVVKHGKKFMGWDEIMDGGISSDAAIMSWRGVENGIKASNLKHEVIMSPTEYAYLDYRQADPIAEPPIHADLRLSKAYQFDPLPTGADPKYIKGAQANLWTEQVYNIRQACYMTWPRGFAIAESIWSKPEKKNWNTFFEKVEQHFKRFDLSNTKYAPSVYDPIFKVSTSVDGALQLELSTEVPGLDIYYSFDNSTPDQFYPKYTGKLLLPMEASVLKVITYKGQQAIGRLQNMPVSELKNRMGR